MGYRSGRYGREGSANKSPWSPWMSGLGGAEVPAGFRQPRDKRLQTRDGMNARSPSWRSRLGARRQVWDERMIWGGYGAGAQCPTQGPWTHLRQGTPKRMANPRRLAGI